MFTCSHYKSVQYFTESLNPANRFKAWPCARGYDNWERGLCSGKTFDYMGVHSRYGDTFLQAYLFLFRENTHIRHTFSFLAVTHYRFVNFQKSHRRQAVFADRGPSAVCGRLSVIEIAHTILFKLFIYTN